MQTCDRLAVEWCGGDEQPLTRHGSSLRQVSPQPLALGWLFDLQPRLQQEAFHRAGSLRLHRNVHLFNCGVAGLLKRAGQWLGNTFAVDGAAAQRVLARRNTGQEGRPMNSRQSHRPRKGLEGGRVKADRALQ